MKAKTWLRIASALILIHLLGHSVGHSTWDNPDDPQMQQVVDAMVGYKAEFMGATRSMGDYYNGYSLIMFLVYGMSICLLLLASSFPESQHDTTRKVLLPIAVAYAGFAIIEFIHFFAFAGAMSLGAALLIFIAIFKSGSRRNA